ncbi:MAG TPA: hypothetical protein VFN78_14255 [Ktedonobacterales bacterium]|nr:hypothetical protein [Ktedonobacterales bacterium]
MSAQFRTLGRRFILVSALALLALLTLGFGASRALAAGASGGTGTITGVEVNGTHGNAPVAGQQVTLQFTIGANAKDVASATTDTQGRFTFDTVDLSSAALGGAYAVYTTFQGGTFATGAINLNASQTQSATLTVYDATQDSANLSVSMATMLVRAPDVTHGLVGIGEFITIRNSGMTAFVGNLPASGTGGAMPSLLRFSLPAAAQNVTTGVGFFGTTTVQISTGFAAAATVPPGQTQFAFAYDLPYTGTTLTVPYKAEYPTAQVVTLVPPNMLVRDSSGIAAQGIVTTFGSRYQVYTASNVAHDSLLTVNLYDLPTPGEPQDLNTIHLYWLAGGLAALLALLLALYLWRGALATTLGLIPATTPITSAPTSTADVASAEAERGRLLRDLLALERRKASGSIEVEQFKREDAALRERLRALLAEQTPGAAVPAASQADPAEETTGVTTGGPR